jgi:ATP-dependent Clp protease protease subunit
MEEIRNEEGTVECPEINELREQLEIRQAEILTIENMIEEKMAAHVTSVSADHQGEIRLRSMVVAGVVDEDMSLAITKNLLTFNAEDPESPIVMYLNTYGGSAHDMLAIYDVMQFISPPIYTVGNGKVMSAGVLLLAAGEPGHRYALPHTSVMIHRVRGGALGTVEDIEASGNHMKELQEISENLLADHTKINKKRMKEFMSGSDSYIMPEEALELGIIDHISAVTPRVLL